MQGLRYVVMPPEVIDNMMHVLVTSHLPSARDGTHMRMLFQN